jgi:hypothetical protein
MVSFRPMGTFATVMLILAAGATGVTGILTLRGLPESFAGQALVLAALGIVYLLASN